MAIFNMLVTTRGYMTIDHSYRCYRGPIIPIGLVYGLQSYAIWNIQITVEWMLIPENVLGFDSSLFGLQGGTLPL